MLLRGQYQAFVVSSVAKSPVRDRVSVFKLARLSRVSDNALSIKLYTYTYEGLTNSLSVQTLENTLHLEKE